MTRFHLYQRALTRPDGSTVKIWYYWFRGPDGAQVRRSTGCELKRKAEEVVDELEAGVDAAASRAKHPRATLRDVAGPMFKSGAAHLARWSLKGRKLVRHTVEQHRRWIDLYIMPAWGSRWIDEISGPEVEDWLIALASSANHRGGRGRTLAATTKNGIGRTMGLIFAEAKRAGYLEAIPELELFERHSRKKDILLDKELEALFPECPAALGLIWGRRPGGGRLREDPEVGLMIGTLYALSVSAGLRPGEARAVHVDQLYRQAGGMIVDRAFDNAGALGGPKKSRTGDPRYRVVYLPDRTWRLLDFWLSRREDPPDYPGLLFPFRGRPLSAYFARDRFAVGLDNAEIKTARRNLSPHSLRYTYDTKMRPILAGDVLREFVGHRSEQMTDHYDRATLRPVLEARLAQLADQRPAVERFWGG